MTTASANHPSAPATPPVGAAHADPGERLLLALAHPAHVVMAALLALGVLALFWEWFIGQHRHSWGNPDWSHAYLVPIISLYLLWQNRHDIAHTPVRVFWPGLVPLVLGIVCYVFFIGGVPNHMGQGFALVLTIFGVCLLLLGARMMTFLFFPIAYLLLAVTISERIMISITWVLRQWAAQGAFVTLRIAGVDALRAGNTLQISPGGGRPPVPLDVAEACSGMRMLIAFVALGVAVALVACRHWWQRAVLLMVAAPVALLVNVFRVALLGFLAQFDADLSAGQAHMLIGTLLLIPGLAIYLAIAWALNRAVHDHVAAAPAGGTP